VRSARFTNPAGRPAVTLLRALSASVDLPPDAPWDLVHLPGTWARERQVVREPLTEGGARVVESVRGISSHQHNPFIALAARDAGEDHGLVYGFNLVYSGNFVAQAGQDAYGATRVLMGIHPLSFAWKLEPGASFQTPECVMVCSGEGFGKMSRAFHQLYRRHLMRGRWVDRERPVLVNNWEATYFDFTAERILALAAEAAPLGIELLVLDDGWFGHRDADNSSLGDWVEDRRKLPGGIAALAKGVEAAGLRFGLWFEPEMISVDSALYRAHPDWCLHVEGRRRTEIRHQLVLDLTRPEVRDAVASMVTAILRSAPVRYVKWDMNRALTEAGSAALPPDRQGEVFHRYTLGVYDLMERLTTAFPEVLFEGCAGGGARFDPGILYYMPQIWTSDNTDAVDRLRIQWGTSLAYPPSAMTAHVSVVPNHQVGRVTPFETRGDVAMSAVFGYELDPGALTPAERDALKAQIAFYKRHRRLIQTGDLYRLISPFEGARDVAAWMIVAPDRGAAFVLYARMLAAANPPLATLRLAGLDPGASYRVACRAGDDEYTAPGDVLMRAGLCVPALRGDFASRVWVLTRV